jgi:hypothetical protein
MCLKAFVDSSVNKRRLAIEELSSKISEAVLSSPSHVGLPVGLGVPSLIKCHDITFNTNHELSHTFIGSCFAESHFSLHELAELSHEFGLDGKLGDDNVDHSFDFTSSFSISNSRRIWLEGVPRTKRSEKQHQGEN